MDLPEDFKKGHTPAYPFMAPLPGMPGLPGMGMPGMPGMPGLPGMPGMPGMPPGMRMPPGYMPNYPGYGRPPVEEANVLVFGGQKKTKKKVDNKQKESEADSG